MSDNSSCVAVYRSHGEAEQAIRTLQQAGLDIAGLSIVGKGYHSEEHPIGYYNAGERVKFWGKQGLFWGGLWGMLAGAAFFWIPGFGPLAIAGPFASVLVGGLEGAAVAGGVSALGAALYSIGIPRDSILRYETELKADSFLLIVHGSEDEVRRAADVLQQPTAADVTVHAT